MMNARWRFLGAVRPTEHGDQDVPPETQDTFVESLGPRRQELQKTFIKNLPRPSCAWRTVKA